MAETVEMATMTLPDESEIVSRVLSVINLYDFANIVARSAGRELNGYGVVLMLHLAIYDSAGGIEPMERLLAVHFEDLIKALVEDEEVQSDALHALSEARTPRNEAPPRPELSDDDKLSLMTSIKKLAAVYDEHASPKDRDYYQKYRDGGANPFYNQTLGGLYLEFYYGHPSKVWTPWGYWHFGARLYDFDTEGFMKRLTVRVYAEERQTDMGCIGPIYALLAVDGEELPEPVLPTDKRQYLSYEESREEWERLFGTAGS